MYGFFFKNKTDNRKLLLDYTTYINPLLKDYPLEGYSDNYYDFFYNQVLINKRSLVEV